jgi:hypothetical protein
MPLVGQTKFMLRKTPYDYFQELEYWNRDLLVNKGGMYLAGPNGVGKSIIVYTLACLAKAKDWIVLYVPDCDEWSALPSKDAALKYLLNKFALALVPFYSHVVADPSNQRLGKTWGDLIALGLTTHTEEVLTDLVSELSNQTDHPLLLIFDEVNALFTRHLPWSRKSLAKDGPFFSYLGASINRLKMNRGWKVISGTGHERFLAALPSGYTNSVRYLIPLDRSEFNMLMESGILLFFFPLFFSVMNC